MKYRLMFLVSPRNNYDNLYKFDTTTINDVTQYREFDTLEEVDTYVENLLNNSKYSRSDIMVVQVKDYEIFTDIYNTISTISDRIIPRTTIYYDKNTEEYYLHTSKNE